MHLFTLTNSYDLVYNWFNVLKEDKIEVVGYVVMPNHVHCILYFPEAGFNLNKILANGKRFMAYGLVDKLEKANDANTLAILKGGLTEREIKKKQLHKVFKDSFDGKPVFSEKFLFQKSNYIHYNPVSGKCPSDWLSSGRGNLQKIFFLMNIAAHHFMKMEFQDISRQSIIKIYRLTLQYFSV